MENEHGHTANAAEAQAKADLKALLAADGFDCDKFREQGIGFEAVSAFHSLVLTHEIQRLRGNTVRGHVEEFGKARLSLGLLLPLGAEAPVDKDLRARIRERLRAVDASLFLGNREFDDDPAHDDDKFRPAEIDRLTLSIARLWEVLATLFPCGTAAPSSEVKP